MDGLFDRFFAMSPRFRRETDASTMGWVPPVEVLTKDGEYLVRVDLPGVDPKDVDVSAHGDTLTIKGERKDEWKGEENDYRYREAHYGTFERRVTLPSGLDTDKIHASYRNGVLEVTMPLPAELLGRKIPIQIGDPERKTLEAKTA